MVKSMNPWWAWQNSNLRPLPCQGPTRLLACVWPSVSCSFSNQRNLPLGRVLASSLPQVATDFSRLTQPTENMPVGVEQQCVPTRGAAGNPGLVPSQRADAAMVRPQQRSSAALPTINGVKAGVCGGGAIGPSHKVERGDLAAPLCRVGMTSIAAEFLPVAIGGRRREPSDSAVGDGSNIFAGVRVSCPGFWAMQGVD